MRIVLKPLGAILVLAALLGCIVVIGIQSRHNAVASGAVGAALPATANPTDSSPHPIVNGSFTDGDKLPTGWTGLPWIGKGTAHLERDTAQFHSAPASLRLEGQSDDSYVALDHLLDGYQEGQGFTVKGWMKAEGQFKHTQIAVRGRDVLGDVAPQKEYVFVADAQPAANWAPFQAHVSLKPGSKFAYLVLVVAGKGKLWVDDLEVVPDAPASPR